MNLAFRMRPQTLQELIGQKHLVGEGKILRRMLEQKQLFSMIFWGPPGTGKTTLAHIIAKEFDASFYALSAVEAGKAELQKILKPHFAEASRGTRVQNDNKTSLRANEVQRGNLAEIASSSTAPRNDVNRQIILFIDEIHRWNKAQQDALLPYVENGLITLIGATTENPSFEIINALLSRSRILVLQRLTEEDLQILINRALTNKEKGLGKYKKTITSDATYLLIRLSGGDARILLNGLEIAVTSYKEKKVTSEMITEIFQTKSTSLYDKKADEHYNTISSYIKSMRASNVDGALYYLARMIQGGEDPKFIARRMVIFASEDVGMAQPTALVVANEVFRACEVIGYPECAINLAHGTVYLAKAKKDRSSYDAYTRAVEDVLNFPNEPIPLYLRNAPTNLMKELGYAKDYSWKEGNVGPQKELSFLPEKLKGRTYYKEKRRDMTHPDDVIVSYRLTD